MSRRIGPAVEKMSMLLRCRGMIAAFVCAGVLFLVPQSSRSASKSDREIWDAIFKVVSESTDTNPYLWMQDKTRVMQIMKKGNVWILDYGISLEHKKAEVGGGYTLELEKAEKRQRIEPMSINLVGEEWIVQSVTDAKMIIICLDDKVFVIDVKEDLVGVLSLKQAS